MRETTVSELMSILEDMPPDAVVRLAFQPSWPLQHTVGDVVEVEIPNENCTECDGEGVVDDEDDPTGRKRVPCKACDSAEKTTVVYIGEGSQCNGNGNDGPYLPGAASAELGWR
jgi:DnaJ-class molecular chaperone